MNTYFVRRRGKRLIGPIRSADEIRELLAVLKANGHSAAMVFVTYSDGELREISRQQVVDMAAKGR